MNYDDPTLIVNAKLDIFVNSDPASCPILNCELKTKDCLSPYKGTDIKLDNKGDFPINFNTTKIAKG